MRVAAKEDITEAFIAPLGELIYEIVGAPPEVGGTKHHSLAHVVVPVGKLSPKHYHKYSEESYYILKGWARVIIDDRTVTLTPGQTCLILPGEIHQLFNDEADTLELLVVCAPAWSGGDYYVLED